MDNITDYSAIIFICACIFLIMFLRTRANFLLSFLARMLIGTSGIYFINQFLEAGQISLIVGINPLSLLTTGSLGFGGVVLLYAIAACKFL